MIEYNCAKCGEAMETSGSSAGKVEPCPQCGHENVAPFVKSTTNKPDREACDSVATASLKQSTPEWQQQMQRSARRDRRDRRTARDTRIAGSAVMYAGLAIAGLMILFGLYLLSELSDTSRDLYTRSRRQSYGLIKAQAPMREFPCYVIIISGIFTGVWTAGVGLAIKCCAITADNALLTRAGIDAKSWEQ